MCACARACVCVCIYITHFPFFSFYNILVCHEIHSYFEEMFPLITTFLQMMYVN